MNKDSIRLAILKIYYDKSRGMPPLYLKYSEFANAFYNVYGEKVKPVDRAFHHDYLAEKGLITPLIAEDRSICLITCEGIDYYEYESMSHWEKILKKLKDPATDVHIILALVVTAFSTVIASLVTYFMTARGF